MKKNVVKISSLVLSASLIITPSAYAATNSYASLANLANKEDRAYIFNDQERVRDFNEIEEDIEEVDENEIEDDDTQEPDADEDENVEEDNDENEVEAEEIENDEDEVQEDNEESEKLEDENRQQKDLKKSEKMKGLQTALANVKGTPAEQVINDLIQENRDLKELLSSFRDLAEVEIDDEEDLEDLLEEEKEKAKKVAEKKKDEYKAYAEALKNQFEAEKEAFKAQLEAAKEQSEEAYEQELEAYQDMLEDLADLYEESDDIENAFEMQTEAVKANLKNLDSYKKLAEIYEQKNNYQGIKAFVNGDHPYFDVPPTVKEGRTLIPFRAISEALQANVSWVDDEKAVIVEKDGVEVKLIIGVKDAFVNGEKVSLDVPAEVIEARTVVPLRFISEAFGANVQWEPLTKSVVIVDELQMHQTTDTNETTEISHN